MADDGFSTVGLSLAAAGFFAVGICVADVGFSPMVLLAVDETDVGFLDRAITTAGFFLGIEHYKRKCILLWYNVSIMIASSPNTHHTVVLARSMQNDASWRTYYVGDEMTFLKKYKTLFLLYFSHNK